MTTSTASIGPRTESKALRALLALALALCLCAVPAALAGCSPSGQGAASGSSQAEAPAAHSGISVALTAADGDQTLLDESVDGLAEGATVLDVLEAAPVDVVTEDSSYGPYVTSINGLAADATHGWTYTVNGEQPVEGAGKTTVSDGDSIAWNYIEFVLESA